LKGSGGEDDPELFAKIYREELIEQHGDIPEVDVVVKGETKLRTDKIF
jgi:hypothetical protein